MTCRRLAETPKQHRWNKGSEKEHNRSSALQGTKATRGSTSNAASQSAKANAVALLLFANQLKTWSRSSRSVIASFNVNVDFIPQRLPRLSLCANNNAAIPSSRCFSSHAPIRPSPHSPLLPLDCLLPAPYCLLRPLSIHRLLSFSSPSPSPSSSSSSS